MNTLTVWFDKESGKEAGRDCWRFPLLTGALLDEIKGKLGIDEQAIMWQTTDHGEELCLPLIWNNGQPMVDPSYQPPPPSMDPIALLTQAVSENVACSPHDKRFLRQKEIGKQAIGWIRQHPTCIPDEAEAQIMGLVLAEMPGQPVVPKLYWEHEGMPQGLAMSYLFEAINRGYLPANTPMTWASLVGLIVATPESQIDAWLRSL